MASSRFVMTIEDDEEAIFSEGSVSSGGEEETEEQSEQRTEHKAAKKNEDDGEPKLGKKALVALRKNKKKRRAAAESAEAAEALKREMLSKAEEKKNKGLRKKNKNSEGEMTKDKVALDFDFEDDVMAVFGAEQVAWDPSYQLIQEEDGATRTSTQDKISLLLAQRKLRGVNKETTEEGEAQDNNDEENETQGPTAGDLSDEEGESDMEEGEDDEVEALPLPQPSMQVSAADLDSDAESEADSEAERRKDDFFDSTPEVSTEKGGSFQDLGLSRALLKGVASLNYLEPSAVQKVAIPVAMAGRDICACAATGSGKTAAFMLPVLERLLFRPKRLAQTRVLVLSPTRELAVQVCASARALAKHTDITFGMAVGGMSVKVQEAELRARPDIVVATPGRLVDHVQNTHSFDLSTVEILIMDEADRLLEVGFTDELDLICKSCPQKRQTMLFSATMTDEVEDLIKLSLYKPVRLFVDKKTKVTDNLVQEFIRIRPAMEPMREAIVLSLCKRVYKERCLVFVRTKKHAHRLRIIFGLANLSAAELHGSLSQAQRLDSLQRFKDSEAEFLICSDLAGRGLDIPGVKSVLNLCMPNTVKQYIHRVGRTARAGQKGRSVTLVGEGERRLMRELHKTNAASMRNRVVKSEVIDKFKAFIDGMEKDIREILKAESQETQIRMAEMEVRKAENMIIHSEEINSRAPRKWIQTKKEKEDAKRKSVEAHLGNGLPSDTSQAKKTKLVALEKLKTTKKEKLTPEQAAAFAAMRQAKRERKPKKIYALNESTPLSHERPPRKRKSGFDSELRDTGKRAKNEGVRTTPKSLLKKTSSKKEALMKGLEQKAKKKAVPKKYAGSKHGFKSAKKHKRR